MHFIKMSTEIRMRKIWNAIFESCVTFAEFPIRDRPFMTSAFFRAVGVKNCENLPTESSKKTADGRGVGVKNCKILPTS